MDEIENDENKQFRKANVVEITPYLQQAKGGNEAEAMVNAIVATMKEAGLDEKSINLQRKFLEARFGIGNWQDVIAAYETDLKELEAKNNKLGQIDTLTQLINLTINAGDKEAARQYVRQAEQLLTHTSASDIEAALPGPSTISGETILQMRQAEINRLHNWVT